jgi:hypothetical protein
MHNQIGPIFKISPILLVLSWLLKADFGKPEHDWINRGFLVLLVL